MVEDTVEVTVVITTCDRPALAERAVESALAQTEPRLEVIVVDDGTEEPFNPSNPDPRVRVIRTAGRIGTGGARNMGLDLARGRWITYLDDDDELRPDMVSTSLAAAHASRLPSPVGVVSGYERVDGSGRVVTTILPKSIVAGRGTLRDIRRMAQHNTLLAPIAVLREVGGFDEQIPASEHTDFFLRLSSVCSLEAVPVVTYRALEHQGARRSRSALQLARGMWLTYQKHRNRFRSDPKQEADYLGRAGMRFLSAGRWGWAVRLTLRALRLDPRRPGALQQVILALTGPRLSGLILRGPSRQGKPERVRSGPQSTLGD